MTGLDFQVSGFSPLALNPPVVLPSIVLVLFIVISPGFGAPPLVQHPVRGSSLVQLDPGRRLYLPHAVQQALGEVSMEGRPGPVLSQRPTSDGSADLEAKDSSSEWETVLDPRLYVITEYGDAGRLTEGGTDLEFERRRRNGGPSLSIVNPLDVLRQRLLFEIARRRMKQNQSQITANEEFLRGVGKK